MPVTKGELDALTLIYKEVTQLRSHLTQTLGLMAALLLLSRKFVPSLAITYAIVFPIVNAISMPQLSFAQEERGNTLMFLRSLPIRPSTIVGSKYVLSLLVTVVFCLMIVVLGPFPYLGSPEALGAVSAIVFMSMFFAGVSLLLHFWLGLKSAKTALLVMSFLGVIPSMLVFSSEERGVDIMEYLTRATAFAKTQAGALVIALSGLVIMGASWAISTMIFTRRDTSQMV